MVLSDRMFLLPLTSWDPFFFGHEGSIPASAYIQSVHISPYHAVYNDLFKTFNCSFKKKNLKRKLLEKHKCIIDA